MRKQIDLDRPRLTWACITKTPFFFHLLFEGNNRRPRKNDYLLTKRLNRRSEVVRVNAGAFAQKDTSVFCFTRIHARVVICSFSHVFRLIGLGLKEDAAVYSIYYKIKMAHPVFRSVLV